MKNLKDLLHALPKAYYIIMIDQIVNSNNYVGLADKKRSGDP